MAQLPTSGIKLFRAFGIQVYLHWSWLVVAVIMIQNRRDEYSSIGWNIAEYLSLFAIVLTHEFGHALACKSVGGQAERIMLWPLGGVAFVSPPPRPGAVLWSIVAGPLVNVVLLPVTFTLLIVSGATLAGGFHQLPMSNFQNFVSNLTWINLLLLGFNMLPIYPLDGGQILRAVLWFVIGQRRSLLVASIIGLCGAGVGLLLAISVGSVWLIVVAVFAAMQSLAAFQRSRSGAGLEIIPRADARCPSCGVHPPVGPFWACPCGRSFDVFESHGICPNCGGMFATVPCPACHRLSPPGMWMVATQQPLVTTPSTNN